MEGVRMLVLLGTVLLAGAGGPMESINPLFTKADRGIDPTLVGVWIEKGDGGSLTFRASGNEAYEVNMVEIDRNTHQREETQYAAHLVRLGDYLFLDVVAKERRASPASHKLRLVRSENENRFEPN